MTLEGGAVVLRLRGEAQHRRRGRGAIGAAGAIGVEGHGGPFPGQEEGFGFHAGASDGTDQSDRLPSHKDLWDVELWLLGQV